MARRKVCAVELARPPLTRWTAQILDRDQEQRFREYNIVSQRRTALITLLAILTINAGVFGIAVWTQAQSPSALRVVAQVVGTAVGIALAVAFLRERRHARLRLLVSASVVAMTALVGVLLATGPNMGFRGAILVVGGVAVIYLAVPLQLTLVTVFALAYSAVTVPIWLVVAAGAAQVDVSYVALTLILAHVLGFTEARRAQRERRVLFSQRETLLALSSVDPLTGLLNRRAADAELARAFAYWQRSGAPLALLMVDIDHFKTLNDSQGHVAGDHALRLVADVIRSVMPMLPGQVAARYGGEEFICLLPGVDAAQATVVAGRILAGVRRIGIPLAAGEVAQAGAVGGVAQAVPRTRMSRGGAILTVSAGVAAVRATTLNPEALVEAADRQLYRAKGDGRNCVRTEPGSLTARGPDEGGVILAI
jgi:diguanylate cyclase (GGDEF)-like protein